VCAGDPCDGFRRSGQPGGRRVARLDRPPRSPASIARSYPPVTEEDVGACMSYAAELAHEEIVPLEPAAA
jgi:hypothetical protein